MKLYVCWTTATGNGHNCGVAYDALKSAGYDPEVVKSYGWAKLPGFLNFTNGRKEAKRRTGSYSLPMLVLDDDSTIAGREAIVDWAAAHPAQDTDAPVVPRSGDYPA